MIRELSQVLLDLHDGLADLTGTAARQGVPMGLTGLDISLPLDMQPVFRDGRCTLLADVPRSRNPGDWGGSGSQLAISLQGQPNPQGLEGQDV